VCPKDDYLDPIRSDELKKTIETLRRLLQSEVFDPTTRNKAEEVKRDLEKELETLRSAGRLL
jgi:hypothetical protein